MSWRETAEFAERCQSIMESQSIKETGAAEQ